MSDTENAPLPTDPRLPSPRQTLSYLRSLFEAHGLEAKSKLGQNFLIDLNLLDLIVRTAELDRSDAVLEVGTGTGSLTARLADHAGVVCTVEIDKTLQPVAHQIVGERPNVRVKLVVNEPMLVNPTDRQMSATERSVVRSNAAARSRRRVSRYACGDSPNARRNSRLKWAGDRPAARARSSTSRGSK